MKVRYFVKNMNDGCVAYWRKTGRKIEYRDNFRADNKTWKPSIFETLGQLKHGEGEENVNEVTLEEFVLLF